MKNKPLLHDMMSNLYYLYKEGYLKKDKIEHILYNEYLIDDYIYKDDKFICIKYLNEDLEIKMSQTIWI